MTAPLTERVPGGDAGHPAPGPAPHAPALRRCVGDDLDRFATEHWGRRAHLARSEDLPRDFTDLLDADAVDELVSRRGLRTPFLRVARDGSTLGERAFTSGAGVGATITDQLDDDKLLGLFAGGATLVLQALHRTWPPLTDFSQALAAELGHPVQVNAYVTPPQSQGFSAHYDVHDVFVLQVQGEKRWVVHEPVHPSPLRDQVWTDRRAQVARAADAAPVLDVVLRPGDSLYLPRGYLHAATALGQVSTHVTVGIHTWTEHALAATVLDAALDRLAEDPTLRASLPLGVDVGAPEDLEPHLGAVVEALTRAARDVGAGDVAARLGRQADRSQRPAPVGPLRQLAAAADLAPTSRVVLRRHLRARLEEDANGTGLRTRGTRLALDPGEADAVRTVLAGRPVQVDRLGLPDDVALDLVRRLLRAGIVEPPA
ncbi:cupin domain-containing protein [Thalassiella azotivora]